jgi:hypothetical protein
MNSSSLPRPKTFILLIVLLILLGLGGIGGGSFMFIDPTGAFMGLPPDLLEGLPISNYILPGLFLVSVMGIFPFVTTWGLWTQRSWAWITAVGQSIVLILWICFQIVLWGTPIALQMIYLIWGIVMLGLCFVPGIKPGRQYRGVLPG